MTTISKEKLAVLIRVSTEDQKNEGHSLDYQLEFGRKKAEELGLDVELYDESNVSGAVEFHDLDRRPELRRLMMDVTEGKIKNVYAYELARFARDQQVTAVLNALFRKHDVKVYTQTASYDLNNPTDILSSGILQLFASYERLNTKFRSKLGLQHAAELGIWIGTMWPFGYDKIGLKKQMKLVINPDEVLTYAQMVDWSLDGMSVFGIANRLNEMGVKTKGSKVLKKGIRIKNKFTKEVSHIPSNELTWKPNTVLSILKNPIYKGERQYKGKSIPFEPKLISAEKWDMLQRNLTRNKNEATRNNTTHFYLLKGLLRCGCCRRNFYGYIKESKTVPHKNQMVYMCSSKRIKGAYCGTKSININRLNRLVWTILTDNHSFLKELVQEIKAPVDHIRVKELQQEYDMIMEEQDSIGNKRERNLELFRMGHISPEELNDAANKYNLELKIVNNKMASNRNELAAIKSKSVNQVSISELMQQVANTIKNYTDIEKQSILKRLVRNITINYNPALFEHTVKIEINYSDLVMTKKLPFHLGDHTDWVSPSVTTPWQMASVYAPELMDKVTYWPKPVNTKVEKDCHIPNLLPILSSPQHITSPHR